MKRRRIDITDGRDEVPAIQLVAGAAAIAPKRSVSPMRGNW
jgi:hypothetical protein